MALMARTSDSVVTSRGRTPAGERHLDIEEPRLPDHDRLGLVRGEAVADQRVMQPRGPIVAAGLPLHPGDRRLPGEMGRHLLHPPEITRASAPSRSRYVTKPRPPGNVTRRSGPSRTTADRAGRLGVGAQLRVVRRQILLGINHGPPSWGTPRSDPG